MNGTLILFGVIVILAISSVLLRPLKLGPIRWILGGLSGLVLATLVRHRAFPFLQHDTILSGGKLYPTAQWAPAMGTFLYVGSAIFLLIGIASLLIRQLWTHRLAKADSA